MKKILTTTALIFILILDNNAQSKWYSTTGGETIFSLMSFDDPTSDATVLRFAPVFNSQTILNNDLGKSFGIYTGIAIRNVGFIADDPADSNIRKKFRTYNLGIPFGIKLGNLNGTFIYSGFDAEYAFNFKEKTFVNGDKIDKEVYWFSDRLRLFQPSVHVGLQFVRGMNIKFKYYLNSFFNPNRTDVYFSEYQRFDGNLFYFSLNSNLFYNTKFIHTE